MTGSGDGGSGDVVGGSANGATGGDPDVPVEGGMTGTGGDATTGGTDSGVGGAATGGNTGAETCVFDESVFDAGCVLSQ
jgi:hypothetical protein